MFEGNPLLSEGRLSRTETTSDTMSVNGTTIKTFILLALVIGAAAFTWNEFYRVVGDIDYSALESVKGEDGKSEMKIKVTDETGRVSFQNLPQFDFSRLNMMMWTGLIGGLFVGLFCIFNPRISGVLGPIYAICEGLALGGISALYELEYGGIVMQAAAGTVGVFVIMLAAYQLKLLRATPGLVKFVLVAMLGVLFLYLADILIRVFGGGGVSIVHSNSWAGIGLSIFVCGLAALNFIIDFDHIEKAVEAKAPKYMEWYCAFSLLVTLVWLYLEILRLLGKGRSRK